MLDAAKDDDTEAVSKLAHKLKGSASNFNLLKFCEQLAQIESAARDNGDLASALTDISELKNLASNELRDAAHQAGLQISSVAKT